MTSPMRQEDNEMKCCQKTDSGPQSGEGEAVGGVRYNQIRGSRRPRPWGPDFQEKEFPQE